MSGAEDHHQGNPLRSLWASHRPDDFGLVSRAIVSNAARFRTSTSLCYLPADIRSAQQTLVALADAVDTTRVAGATLEQSVPIDAFVKGLRTA